MLYCRHKIAGALAALLAVFLVVGIAPRSDATPIVQSGPKLRQSSSSSSSSSGGGSLTHGQQFTASGLSGAGTRTGTTDIFDDASAANPDAAGWDGGNVEPRYLTPAAAGRSVPLPHSNITKYIADNYNDGVFGAMWLGKSVPSSSPGQKVFMIHLRRYDPLWTYADDNNTKYFTVATGGNGAFDSPYWYHDQTDPVKTGLTNQWGDSFFSSGGLGSMDYKPASNSGGSGAQSEDPWYNWVQFEHRITLSNSAGTVDFLINNVSRGRGTGLNNYGSGSATAHISVGCFCRAAQFDSTNEWVFLADIYLSVGADAFKRVMLCNNATYASATICEPQPIVSWADTSITYRVNKGRLSAGTVYEHVFTAESTSLSSTSRTLNWMLPMFPFGLRRRRAANDDYFQREAA